TVCVVGKMRDLILQLSKSSIYSTKLPGGARANKVWFQRENMLKVIDMLEQWQPLCARYQCTIPTLALAWILKQSDLISILSGATAPEQVRENVAALIINLSDADATLMREMAEALER
ncbi:aldo/keto reductase, partial [Escherichia coli]